MAEPHHKLFRGRWQQKRTLCGRKNYQFVAESRMLRCPRTDSGTLESAARHSQRFGPYLPFFVIVKGLISAVPTMLRFLVLFLFISFYLEVHTLSVCLYELMHTAISLQFYRLDYFNLFLGIFHWGSLLLFPNKYRHSLSLRTPNILHRFVFFRSVNGHLILQ